MSDPVSTRMADRLVCVASQLGQLSLSSLRVDKSSTNLPGWSEGGAVTSVGWQITLCDPTDKWRPVVLKWISLRTICSFTFAFMGQTRCRCWVWYWLFHQMKKYRSWMSMEKFCCCFPPLHPSCRQYSHPIIIDYYLITLVSGKYCYWVLVLS